MEITQGQIESWKAKHKDVWLIEVGGKKAYLKKPNRQALSAALVISKNDTLKYNEVLLNNCWLGGDEEIKEDDSLFLGVATVLGDLVEIKEATLKKL
ncbi:MAG: hypothetical protein R3Y50_06145 [Rikenellaceae bacterium]